MAAEYSANALQTVPANGSVIFTESPVPCNQGLIYHRDGSGLFRLANRFFRQNIMSCCRRNSDYLVSVSANIAIPTGGTVEPISFALAIDGEVDPSTIMIFTPAAVEQFGNISAVAVAKVPYICACSTVSLRNVSTQPVDIQNVNIVFGK